MERKMRIEMLSLLSVGLCMPAVSFAQDKVDSSVGADLVSGYVWRGQNLGGVSIQPSASISYKGFSLTGWGSVGIDKTDTKEFDLTLGYATGGFSVSVTDYWFNTKKYFHYEAHNTAHVFEAQVGYDFDILAVNWYTNFAGDDYNADGDRAFSSYFSISAPFRLGSLDWSAEVGMVPWKSSATYGYADGFEVCNVSLGVSKDIAITDKFSLPVYAKATWNPATECAYFVFGLHL